MEAVDRVFGKESRTYLMGWAIIGIVLFHVWLWSLMSDITPSWWISIFNNGALGVDVFLLLSAYGLQASLEKNNMARFYKNRFKRLFPVCLLFLLILFVIFDRDCPYERILAQCVCQLTGLSLFKYPDFFSCGFCFDWFTPAIIFMYICFPLASKVVGWIVSKGMIPEILTLVVLTIVAVVVRNNIHLVFSLLAIRLPIIYLGMITYLHLKDEDYQRILLIIVVAACLGLLADCGEVRLSLLMPPILVVFSMTKFELPLRNIVCAVGRHSYEVYLAHIFAVAFFIPTRMVTNTALLLLITIVSTFVLSYVFSFIQQSFYRKWN